MPDNTSLHNDLLRGAAPIAKFLWGDEKMSWRVYHLSETRRLPVFRDGNIICARKSSLLSWIENQERQAVGA